MVILITRLLEAKQWLFTMIDRDVKPNTITNSNLIDSYYKEGNRTEAKKHIQSDWHQERTSNLMLSLYNAMITMRKANMGK